MKRRLFPALLIAAALAGGAEAGTVVTVPTDLNPGDQYRLVFVTNGTRDAQSTDIADYNSFVTTQANLSAELAALSTNWSVIGSTSTVSARVNTGTDGSGGVPIYLPVGGDHRIADDYNDLWDGTIGHPLNIDQFGNSNIDVVSFTGSARDGSIGSSALGVNVNTLGGLSTQTGPWWIELGIYSSNSTRPFYAISDLLTVPGAPVCDGTTAVGSEAKLNDAIAAFNAETITPCVHTIKLTADIALSTSTTPIDNSLSGVSLVIDGNGYQVDGQSPTSELFSTQPFALEAGTVVSMEDLTITGGSAVGSGPENRGGGIRNHGTLTLTRCTVADNRTHFRGGGIANRGTLEIVSSTISGNTAGTEGVGQAAQGGGIYSEGGSVTITNSTLSGNAAESDQSTDRGGAIYATGSLTLASSTITENFANDAGSGIYVQTAVDDLTIGNTILAANPDFSFSDDCYFSATASGTVQDQGYNVFLRSDGCGLVNGQNNNIQSAPQLEPLADNGGPTQTHALNASLNSPAIDAGNTTLTVDQRGVARPSGAADDIGAFESLGCEDAPWSVASLPELSYAIECFNAVTTPGSYTISIEHGILATQSTTAIDNATPGVELVIEGNGNSGDWNGNLFPGVRPFLIEADTTVTINDFAITNGNVQGTERGGGIHNLGNLTINRCSIAGNRSEYDGGGISNGPDAVMAINDSTVWGNVIEGGTEPVAGGGIYNAGNLTIKNSTVSTNTSSNDGGGIASIGPLELDSVTVTANSAQGAVGGGAGAGVFIGSTGTLVAQNSILAGSLGADAEDCWSFLNTVTDGGHNLVETQLGCEFADGINGTIVGQDPLLGALRDNGGPTRTHALQIGSPAIDAGDTDLTTDQRGEPRPGGPEDDIGAFEEEQLGTITVVKESDVDDPTNFPFSLNGGDLAAPIDFYLDTSLEDLDGIWYSKSFPLAAGAYSITETPVGSTGPVAIECEDDDGPLGSFTGDTADVSLTAYQHVTCTFTNGTIYSVTATAVTNNGSVSCSPSFVGKGGTSTCTAVPEAGYRVKEWTGACASWGSNLQCYLSKITEENASTVSFEKIPQDNYTVHATVASGLGTVSCDPTLVLSGGTSTCTATPDDGFRVSAWTGACQDESAAGTSTTCTLTDITGAKTSTVAFEAIPTYSVTATSDGNGTVACEPETVEEGGSSTCTALPDDGFQVSAWTGACQAAGSNAVCTLTDVRADQPSTVSFRRSVGGGSPEPIPAISSAGLLMLLAGLLGVGGFYARRQR